MANPPKTDTFFKCCFKSYPWSGTPTGHITTLCNLPTYTAGTSASTAILVIHDALGWTFPNLRLLADSFATEANATVFMPDFFGGEVLDAQALLDGRWEEVDMDGFRKRNSRERRDGAIMGVARELRGRFGRVGVVGYCWGGWGVMRLGAKEHVPPLVDCAIAAHPSWLTAGDIDNYGSVPIQFLAPEKDGQFTHELKLRTFQRLVLKRTNLGDNATGGGVAVEYVHMPGVTHGCLTKGAEHVAGEREAMAKGKDAAVSWFRHWLSERDD